MGIYNFEYDPRTDPKALFAQGAQNLIGGLMQGQDTKRLGEFAGGMDPNATAMQIVVDALKARLSPQIAMGLGGLQQRGQPNIGAIPWASTQMTPAQRQNWLDNYGRGVTIQTGEKLLTPEQRQERAETEFREKVGLSPAEKNLARKSAEEILKGTKGRWFSYDIPGVKTYPDYTQGMMLENYKTWRAENSYDEQTPRKQKELDDVWDAKMALWSKSGVKFDKDNIIGKDEIDWDPTDPEVRRLREGQTDGFLEPTIPFGGAAGAGRTAEQVSAPETGQAEPVDQARLQSVEKYLQTLSEPKDLIDDLKAAFGAIKQGADPSAVFERVIEEYKDRPELQAFISQVIKPFVK